MLIVDSSIEMHENYARNKPRAVRSSENPLRAYWLLSVFFFIAHVLQALVREGVWGRMEKNPLPCC